MKPLKILSLPVDDGGCGWYRIRQPFEQIKRFTEHDTHIVDPAGDDMIATGEALALADVIVLRPGAERGLPALRAAVKEMGKDITAKIVMDIDDNTEDISPYNYHYHEYGTEEFYDNNAKQWLWKDGQDGFDLQKNRAKLLSLQQGIREADLVTVTTPKLAEYARKYNKNVAILPNCINFERWWKLSLKENEQLRVGWSGGVSHYEDWYSIKEPLNELMRKYQFKLVMTGADFKGIIDEDNQHLVEIHDWVPFKGHSYRMMALALDIAIIPLADLPFNHYKSAVKWYEMSAMGVPSLVSDVTPYKEEIHGAGRSLTYSNEAEFTHALELLITNPELRLGIGEGARQWVEANRDAKKCAQLWISAYQSLIDNN